MQESRAGHVVVCGIGAVGVRTIEQLHAAGVEVVAVEAGDEPGPGTERLLDSWGVPRVPGRPREALAAAAATLASVVVVVPEDDLATTETALLVHRQAPDVRLIVRIANSAVGRALAEVAGPGSVLDVAALSAPSIVEACLGVRPHPVQLAGQEFVVARLAAPRSGTLRELYGDLAPIAAGDGDRGVVCPGRDHRVDAGEPVGLIGTAAQFAASGSGALAETVRAGRSVGARSAGAARAAERDEEGGRAGLLSVLRILLAEAERPLRVTALVLLGVFVLSVFVLHAGYVKEDGAHMTWVDAVYFTVETIGTVGYGDFSFAEQQTWLRVYAIGMMFGGVVLAAVLFSLLTQMLVSSSIERSVGRRRLGSMKGHVIVVGLGAVGIGVLEGLLAAGARPVVLERDPRNRHLPRARELGVPVLTGDATDAAVLASVNLAASAVAVLTSDDLVNIETGLAVRDQLGGRWADVPVVLRIFDRDLSEAVEEGFDFRYVRSTAALASPWFVGAALGLDVLGTFYVDRTPFMIGRIAVTAGSGLDGLAMGELSARTRVVALLRAGATDPEFPPRRGTRFGLGDDAYVVGPYEELLALLRQAQIRRNDAGTPPGRDQSPPSDVGIEIP
ncbi:MAG: Calcium-gated potassium channel mthK [Pseudonocardia sp.]|uniref:potassium channel family protein n=1 Tax=Pseudonocardia sp. TaxID=60912 RepID=UPI002627E4D7|nr:potassium channel family protein [Pseudonocardia sp.]MCU1630774.1 Calcium-gated potassium channel mthK [Pseudonocardia sp.]